MTGKRPEDYQMEDFVTDETFVNYFFRLNYADEVYWGKWIAAHPDKRETTAAAIEMLRMLSLTLPVPEYKSELSRIRKSIHYKTDQNKVNKSGIARILHWKPENISILKKKNKFLLPLSIVILFFATGLYFYFNHHTAADQWVENRNETNKPIVLTLSDGTVVTLATQCIFRYPRIFGNKSREVYLDGEARFEVNRNEAHPFQVHSGDIVATVLGTVFNIKKQTGDSVIVVELLKGKLKVETIQSGELSSQAILLNPDERAVFNRNDQKLYKEKWGSRVETLLQPSHLLFRQSNFTEIASQLKTAFGITVVNQSDKKDWQFTGEFKNTSALNILESICIVKKLKYEVRGDTVIIK